MRALNLNHRCRIEEKVVTLDPIYRSEVVTWQLVGIRWCELQDTLPSRAEGEVSNLSVSQTSIRCRLRYCTDIDSAMRLVVNRPDPVVYQIISGPAEVGQKHAVELMLEKIE